MENNNIISSKLISRGFVSEYAMFSEKDMSDYMCKLYFLWSTTVGAEKPITFIYGDIKDLHKFSTIAGKFMYKNKYTIEMCSIEDIREKYMPTSFFTVIKDGYSATSKDYPLLKSVLTKYIMTPAPLLVLFLSLKEIESFMYSEVGEILKKYISIMEIKNK